MDTMTIGFQLGTILQKRVAPHLDTFNEYYFQVCFLVNGKSIKPICSVEVVVTVPYHGGGRSKKINAWYLNTLMVYL